MYNKLINQDHNEFSTEERPHHAFPKTRQKVSMFAAVNGSSFQAYRLTTVILGILCGVLMATIVALCASYKGLNEKHAVLSQNSSETNSNLQQLSANHELLAATLKTVQKNYLDTVNAKVLMQRERDRERQGKDLLQRQKEALKTEETKLLIRITELENSCERCPVGWELLNSSCYFFSRVDSDQQQSWPQSRERCQRSGADLVVIDTEEKQEFISRAIKRIGPSSRYWHTAGYWIGLRDVHTEGEWKWVNGTVLTNG
ncbi:hypothetical protein AAFF_G00012090 [Aldrovandia affinis]|uniref:C-type lectin domain-containing protein n=1 Tax=Aldrovandia affinis TaxID=143900 RepID=A0AAD7S6I7_9TELE|nr:hypothetical protein AAFF_G00012090 [Aldrovandia affinis]